ncbi:MAG: hypothetical protein K6A32_09240 [Bacteroidales bacterium]|nr:hypothetical protein [Bacteroidales bacterium]
MSKKRIVCLVMSLVAAMPALLAQDGLNDIRKHYAAVKEHIARMETENAQPPRYYELTIFENLPGTGRHTENMHFYYCDVKLAPEEIEGDVELHPHHWLELATAKYNYAAREFYEEYLYDEQQRITFIYARTPDYDYGREHEFRLYFDEDKLIRVHIKSREGLEGPFAEEYLGQTLPENARTFYDILLQRAAKFPKLYRGIDENTYY